MYGFFNVHVLIASLFFYIFSRASDMDLAPQESKGNTQLLVDNSVTSNLHHDDRNVRTTGEFIVVIQAISLKFDSK